MNYRTSVISALTSPKMVSGTSCLTPASSCKSIILQTVFPPNLINAMKIFSMQMMHTDAENPRRRIETSWIENVLTIYPPTHDLTIDSPWWKYSIKHSSIVRHERLAHLVLKVPKGFPIAFIIYLWRVKLFTFLNTHSFLPRKHCKALLPWLSWKQRQQSSHSRHERHWWWQSHGR